MMKTVPGMLSCMMILLLAAGPVDAFPPITSPNDVVVSVKDFTQVPATGPVLAFRATIELCTGEDITSWGTFTPQLFRYGTVIATGTAGTPVLLCPSGTTNCPHPSNSQCIPYAFVGSIAYTDPRMGTGERAVVDVSLDFVVQPSNSNIRFLNESEAAQADLLSVNKRENYIQDKPNKFDEGILRAIRLSELEESNDALFERSLRPRHKSYEIR